MFCPHLLACRNILEDTSGIAQQYSGREGGAGWSRGNAKHELCHREHLSMTLSAMGLPNVSTARMILVSRLLLSAGWGSKNRRSLHVKLICKMYTHSRHLTTVYTHIHSTFHMWESQRAPESPDYCA